MQKKETEFFLRENIRNVGRNRTKKVGMKHFSQKAVTLKKQRRISIGPMRRPMKKRKVSLKNTAEI